MLKNSEEFGIWNTTVKVKKGGKTRVPRNNANFEAKMGQTESRHMDQRLIRRTWSEVSTLRQPRRTETHLKASPLVKVAPLLREKPGREERVIRAPRSCVQRAFSSNECSCSPLRGTETEREREREKTFYPEITGLLG